MTDRYQADVPSILGGLKDFQRATVDLAFRRLWLDEPPARRFLVADEVGLGKTLVARGVIAKAIAHLAPDDKPLNIVYICSNRDIARQNLSRLNVVGGVQIQADRLSLLPMELHKLGAVGVNFIAFTPGTSSDFTRKTGRWEERVLLYHLFARTWEGFIDDPAWIQFFRAGTGYDSFVAKLRGTDPSSLDDKFCSTFAHLIESAPRPESAEGKSLASSLRACAAAVATFHGDPPIELARARNELIGRLRQLLASAALNYLNASLVILDEFQRFTTLISAQEALEDETDDDAAGEAAYAWSQANTLARAVFRDPKTRVLLLSATPFKMYTLPDDPEGVDHYQEFLEVVRFLGGPSMEGRVKHELRVVREFLQDAGDETSAHTAHDSLQASLRHIMTRTERLAATPDRSGMLEEREFGSLRLELTDLRSWRTFGSVAHSVDHQDVFEYWRSSPYPLNLMDARYRITERFRAAAERGDPAVVAALTDAPGLLSWDDIENYRVVDPGNAKLRALAADVFERPSGEQGSCSASQLLWLPPALPYYEPRGPYAEPGLHTFSKRLVFSAWNVVPKAISVMLNYESQRRALAGSRFEGGRYGDAAPNPPLTYAARNGAPSGAPTTLTLLYPSIALASAGDPLRHARDLGELPLDPELLFYAVQEEITQLLTSLPEGDPPHGTPDPAWYWVAPFLLDKEFDPKANIGFRVRMQESDFGSRDDVTDGGPSAGFRIHVEAALGAGMRRRAGGRPMLEALGRRLGARPPDLAEVLTKMAIGGPGVCAVRALSRVCGGGPAVKDPLLRENAFRVASGLRSLFNKPEVIANLALTASDASMRETYWLRILDHTVDGCLQSVLDEYAHVLVESEGLQTNLDPHVRAEKLADAMSDALRVAASVGSLDDIRVAEGEVVRTTHRVSGHFAAVYGDNGAGRRVAFNSPFRPFVLATTSVGQEGLDFHTYCHAVVHWNLPTNPVDLEQREGRVHRYKGHAVRKNVARAYASAALNPGVPDPWEAVFEAARKDRAKEDLDIKPYWVFTYPPRQSSPDFTAAVIERYVPAMPLSRETRHHERLRRTIGAYRLTIGQPRQEDLVEYMRGREGDYDWLRMDLAPTVPLTP